MILTDKMMAAAVRKAIELEMLPEGAELLSDCRLRDIQAVIEAASAEADEGRETMAGRPTVTTDLDKLLADAAGSAKVARRWARAFDNLDYLDPEEQRDAARAIRGFVGDVEAMAEEIAHLAALNGELVAACRLALGAFKLEPYEAGETGGWSCGECGRSVPTRQQSLCAEFHEKTCPRMVIAALIEKAEERT